jgi:hypothetical protein
MAMSNDEVDGRDTAPRGKPLIRYNRELSNHRYHIAGIPEGSQNLSQNFVFTAEHPSCHHTNCRFTQRALRTNKISHPSHPSCDVEGT